MIAHLVKLAQTVAGSPWPFQRKGTSELPIMGPCKALGSRAIRAAVRIVRLEMRVEPGGKTGRGAVWPASYRKYITIWNSHHVCGDDS